MGAARKITISLPKRTASALDRAARRKRRSRSAAVTEAIEAWLAKDLDDADRRYVEGYRRQPERASAGEAGAGIAAETWEPWE